MTSPSFSVHSQREPETLSEPLRVRAESQAEKNAYTFLIDDEMEEARLSNAELDQEKAIEVLEALLPAGIHSLQGA